jgi:hypothetical protein
MLTYNLQELYNAAGEDMEPWCRELAVLQVKRELDQAVADGVEELALMDRFHLPSAGMYQPHPKQLLANFHAEQTASMGNAGGIDLIMEEELAYSSPSMSPRKKEEPAVDGMASILLDPSRVPTSPTRSTSGMRCRVDSINSETHSVESAHTEGLPKQRNFEATMFLDADETSFYQAEDGKLCFLSGFNMNCLRADFSAIVPDETPA